MVMMEICLTDFNLLPCGSTPKTRTQCFSPVMAGASRWIRSHFPDLSPIIPVHPEHARTWAQSKTDRVAVATPGIVRMNVVWMSRRTFEAMNGPKLNGHQAKRVIGPDEDKLILALQQHILQWNSGSCLMQPEQRDKRRCRQSMLLYDFVNLEGSDKSFEDQVHAAQRAALVAGVHGAALTHQVFQPPGT